MLNLFINNQNFMKTNQSILAAALVVLAACTKANVENVNTGKLEGEEIGFNVVNQKATKANNAIITGTTYGTDNSFKVWGWQSQKGDYSEFSTGAASNFMTNLTIEYTKGADAEHHDFAWRNAEHYYYWPFTGAIGFLAIHPSDLSASTYTALTPAWEAGEVKKAKATITGYTISAANKTVDLMFASNKGTRESVVAGDGKVGMVFKHALSQIEVRVKTNEDYSADLQFDVDSVRFNNIDLSGDVLFSNDAISWSENTTQTAYWDYYTTAKTDIRNYDLSTTEGKASALYGAANLMIPQAANIKAGELESTDPNYVEGDLTETTIIIGYSMQQKPLANNAKITGTVTISKPQIWEAGKKYNYTINFRLNEILFNPSVTDWVDVNVETINIY